MFRFSSQQVDNLPDQRTPDAQLSQDLFVFQKSFIAHQPDKGVSFDPVPQQSGAGILGNRIRGPDASDSCYQDGSVHDSSRPFSFLCGQQR